MHTYTIEFMPRDPANAVFLELERPFLTSRDFRLIIKWLFMTACDGIDYARMNINISRDGVHIFDMYSETVVDGSAIDCYVSINGSFYRAMNIAS